MRRSAKCARQTSQGGNTGSNPVGTAHRGRKRGCPAARGPVTNVGMTGGVCAPRGRSVDGVGVWLVGPAETASSPRVCGVQAVGAGPPGAGDRPSSTSCPVASKAAATSPARSRRMGAPAMSDRHPSSSRLGSPTMSRRDVGPRGQETLVEVQLVRDLTHEAGTHGQCHLGRLLLGGFGGQAKRALIQGPTPFDRLEDLARPRPWPGCGSPPPGASPVPGGCAAASGRW